MVSTEIAERDRFVVLDGMRGLAALAVIADHVPSDMMQALLPGRYLAVDFFFILSGFVLAHVYGERLHRGMSLWTFMRVRLIRLYPLYLAAILISVAFHLAVAAKGWAPYSSGQVLTSFAFALFLLPCPPGLTFWPNAPFPLAPPAWSLFYELVINAVYALVGRFLTPAICLGFMGVGAGALILTVASGAEVGGHAWSNILGGLMRVTFGFFTGVWLYKMRAHWRVPALPAWAAFVVLFAALAMPAPSGLRPHMDLVLTFFILPPLVAMSADIRVSGRVLSLCAFLGLVSYGVYILHVPIFSWLRLTLHYFGAFDFTPGIALVTFTSVVAVTAATALHFVYDIPVRRWLARNTSRGRERAGPLAAP